LLQINGDDLMISGTVTADSVLGLEEWLNNHSHNAPGLSE